MVANPDFLASWHATDGCEPHSLRTEPALLPVTGIAPELFALFRQLVYRESGIWLDQGQAGAIAGRLSKRLHELGLATLKQYYRYVLLPQHAEERAVMLDSVIAQDTHFFREPKHFEFLAQRLFPRWQQEAAEQKRPRRVRVWSVGCSTGEEPFSIAMMLLSYFPPELGWDIEVLGSDISRNALSRASAGVWPVERSAEIPHDLLQRYMLKGVGEQAGWMKAGPEILKMVRFSRVNLVDRKTFAIGIFDLLFCRNVLTYFDEDAKFRVLDNLTRHLSPQGFLFVSRGEEIESVSGRLRRLLLSIYGEVGENGKFLYDFRSR